MGGSGVPAAAAPDFPAGGLPNGSLGGTGGALLPPCPSLPWSTPSVNLEGLGLPVYLRAWISR